MKHPIELVVFDIAGTTVQDNGEIARAFQTALKAYGYTVPVEKINPLMGYKKTDAIKKILDEFENEPVSVAYINDIHQNFLKLMVDHYSSATEIKPLPHAEDVFAYLKNKNIKIGLDTGFPKEITDVIIDKLGWLQRAIVDHVISSSEVPAGRPFPYMIEALMLQTGVKDANKVIKVGDTEVDVFEGKNAGCLYSIAITTGAFTKEELMPYEPSFIIDDLQELIAILDTI